MRGRYARKIPIITAVCFFIFTANAWVTRAMAAELPRLGTASNGADGEDLGDELVFFRRGEGTTVEVPIVMYHLVTTNGSLIGRYGISPSDLEHDLKYLKESGYKTIGMSDLTAFVYKGRALPEKCVMLTFDDGNAGDYFFLYPLLKKYDAKAVLSIMGKQTDQFTADAEKYPGGKFPNLTWPQIREMLKDGRVEIQSHGYDVHKPGGSGRRGGETAQAYRERFKKDIQQLQTRCKEELGCAPDTFTYPLGIMSDGSREVLESLGFKATLSCTEGMNYITQGDPDGLFKLKRDIRPSGRTIEQVLARMVRKKR